MKSEIELQRLEIERELDSASKYLGNSLSENTKRAYRAQLEQFSAWCLVRGLDPIPASPETVCVFIAWLADRGKKVATIARMLSSISKAHKVANVVNPIGSELVKDQFVGIKRKLGTDQDRVDPITEEDLKKIADSFSDSIEDIRNRALIMVGFFGGFRRSELVSVGRKEIKITDEGIRIKIARSKTDQEGKGFYKSIPRKKEKKYCPVAAIEDWLIVAPDSRFLFCHIEGASGPVKEGKRLSDKMVARLIQRIADRLGIKGWFAGHSLRAGFVTAAAKAGKSNRAIMKMTGHKSYEMVDRYVRLANEFEDNAAEGLIE